MAPGKGFEEGLPLHENGNGHGPDGSCIGPNKYNYHLEDLGQKRHDEWYEDIIFHNLPVAYMKMRNTSYGKEDFGLLTSNTYYTLYVFAPFEEQAMKTTKPDLGGMKCNYCMCVGLFLQDYNALETKNYENARNGLLKHIHLQHKAWTLPNKIWIKGAHVWIRESSIAINGNRCRVPIRYRDKTDRKNDKYAVCRSLW